MNIELPFDRCDFVDSRIHPGIAFVDKKQHILHLSDRYRHLLLRPPSFGKTAFLTTLEHYYDIHQENRFDDHFGPLAVMTANTDSVLLHNHHLCLTFRFSHLDLLVDVTKIAGCLRDHIEWVLQMFLFKY
ncbi:hypothetical protein B0H10DRAFT_1308126 [Mycena sp. CBHHK59/15]|nr:hypothetical protein B0H10DRAFT_1308126 [Mycena sp. CBHHK59/15]